ncbi:hypothetical protein DPMN_139509 [Dreissena polymorpha]|uniref:Uncharacterized protein n=1 Tax=Dreissena polymorpha TaxID=45954 RepID=A0A9D4G959_DREPO|nr:hypothetical protein DPMN_139509 [Dreissena polymorpha]
MMSFDMSNMTIFVKNGSVELFEILPDTNIGTLNLLTADCVSLASKIMYTLKKLKKLILWGTYSERCTVQLPKTLECISLQKVECSADRLCSLLIALSSLDHFVRCHYLDVVLQPWEYSSGGDSQTHVSDLRSEMPSLDMTHMPIDVENGSVELFEILRDTSIGILVLRTEDCASSASRIMCTLKKLTKLFCGGLTVSDVLYSCLRH